MARKGTARTATAASVILQQAATPATEPVEYTLRQVESPGPDERGQTAQVKTTYGEPAYKPAKKGVKTGLKQGETRVTCILREDQAQVLRDWAKTTGRTFRAVTLAMAERYIDEVIRTAAGEGLTVRKGDKKPPEAYADLYGDTPDKWAKFFE